MDQSMEWMNQQNAPAPGEDLNLSRLDELVAAFERLQSEADELIRLLKEKTDAIQILGGTDIPYFLRMAGLSEIKLASGKKVIVKEDLSVTIKDQDQFTTWLKSRGEDEIIKMAINFDRMPTEKRDELFQFLMSSDFSYNAENKVHSATLKKYFKELLGTGKNDQELADGIIEGKIIVSSDVETFASVYSYFKTTIK